MSNEAPVQAEESREALALEQAAAVRRGRRGVLLSILGALPALALGISWWMGDTVSALWFAGILIGWEFRGYLEARDP